MLITGCMLFNTFGIFCSCCHGSIAGQPHFSENHGYKIKKTGWCTRYSLALKCLPNHSRRRHRRQGNTADAGGYWTTRGYANSRITNSWTGRLADWTTRGCHWRLCVLSFWSFGGIYEIVSCPVRELTSPRVGVSASCPVTMQAVLL